MAIICEICGKKQHSFIANFPLTDFLQSKRICAVCKERIDELRGNCIFDVPKYELDKKYLVECQKRPGIAADVVSYLNDLMNECSLKVQEYQHEMKERELTRLKENYFTINFSIVDGIPSFVKGTGVKIIMEDDMERISIQKRLEDSESVYLAYSQITNISTASEKEITEQGKSVVGRAAIGGLLLGPLGAIVGGISGTGNKKRFDYKTFLIINYHPSLNPDEVRVLSFEVVDATLGLNKFLDKMKSVCPSVPAKGGYL